MRHVTEADPAKGILDFRKGLEHFRLRRSAPAPDLRHWIESYWMVAWDMPQGQVHRQTNVSHASINVAFEPKGAFLYGVPQRTFVRDISGSVNVFGIKFRPGGFFPFHGRSVRGLTGRRLPFDEAFGGDAAQWARAMQAAAAFEEWAEITNAFWRGRRPAEGLRSATLIAEKIISDRSLLTVAQAAEVAGLTVRGLQRLFHREVGISPKEVIRRFRLQEAAQRLIREPDLACGELALDLGYFDQAHFIRDFRSVVGVTPEVYRRRQ